MLSRHSRTGLAVMALSLGLSSAACHPEARLEPASLPGPPFTREESGLLRVRADLLAQLRFERVERTALQATLQGFGSVAFAPGASYAVRSAVPAYVERVLVTVGQTVSRGTALAVLRAPEVARLRGESRRLQVELSTARDEVTRLARLVPAGAASDRELVAARARIASLQAELSGVSGGLTAANAAAGAGDTFTLRATAPGQVIERSVDPGERVDPSDAAPAFLIGDPSSVVVRAAFPEREAPMLVTGAPCTFVVSALGADRFEGEVTQIVQAVDPTTHTAAAICRPRAANPRLRAEMAARVDVDASGAPSVLAPRSALMLRRDDRVVFVRRAGGALERRAVEVGADFGDRVQILRGLDAGDEVVAENAVLLDGEFDQLL